MVEWLHFLIQQLEIWKILELQMAAFLSAPQAEPLQMDGIGFL